MFRLLYKVNTRAAPHELYEVLSSWYSFLPISLNGWPNLQKGQAQWLVNIQAMQTSRYELDLTLSGGMTGSIDDLSAPAEVTISGQRMSEQMTVSGAFALNDL